MLLDASAYIAYIGKESGYNEVQSIIDRASINMVTYTEIISFYARKGVDNILLKKICKYLDIIGINEEISFNAGIMIKISQEYGLSLGDRICLATATHFHLPIYTADKIWLNLAAKLDVNIILIR